MLRNLSRFAPAAVTAGLVLLIAYQLATITWTIVPDQTFDLPAPVVARPAATASGATATTADYSALQAAHLFGEAAEQEQAPIPAEAELEAPDTTLSIRLTGVIEQTEGDGGQAIIASGRSDEKKYGIGQTIDGANGATLHAVYRDRVILNRGGQLETLRLPKDAAPTQSGRVARAPAPAPAVPPSADEPPLRNVISENASQLTNIMRLSPHVEGGQMVGFRVNPGRDRETFEALGLMPGDVVTDINGMVLDDPSRGLQVFEALGESTMANVTIMRDGSPTVIVIDTSQLQNIAENRQ
ncbi:MAG: type II secretion system protein GspC [Gammaproteobacteria bacterium]|nr:type II secretion system protein GspC [Gammaproteobacteria bacterium]